MRNPRLGADPGDQPGPQTFAAPMVGMVCSSMVVVAVIAAAVAFCASMLALLAEYRRPALQVAAIAGWVIAAWLVMAAMIPAGIKFAVDRVA